MCSWSAARRTRPPRTTRLRWQRCSSRHAARRAARTLPVADQVCVVYLAWLQATDASIHYLDTVQTFVCPADCGCDYHPSDAKNKQVGPPPTVHRVYHCVCTTASCLHTSVRYVTTCACESSAERFRAPHSQSFRRPRLHRTAPPVVGPAACDLSGAFVCA